MKVIQHNCIGGESSLYHALVVMQVLGRVGTVEECGKLCVFLAADATFMTGVDLPITGGSELDYGKKCQTPISDPIQASQNKLPS